MEFKQYIEKACGTESCDMIAIGIRMADTQLIRMLHAALGMATGIEELSKAISKYDYVNIQEEIGDLLWYVAIAYDASKRKFGDAITIPCVPQNARCVTSPVLASMQVQNAAHVGLFVDIMKRAIFYDNYSMDCYRVNTAIGALFMSLYWTCVAIGIPMRDIMNDNIAKLQKRYDGKFSAFRALNRDIDNELSHIKDQKDADNE